MNDATTPPPAPGSAPAAPRGERIRFAYRQRPGLGWLSIKNFLLTLVTLGIYRFWAKTNVRKHIWSSVHINDEPLEYTGTGTELFLGAVIIFLVLGLPIVVILIALQAYFGPQSPVVIVANLVIILLTLMLYGMAIYRARRYRLSRTLWRGIRGTLSGSPFSFSMLYFGAMLLAGMTMGWSRPAMNINLQERLIGDMHFGDQPFRFKGLSGPLYARYALCWFLTPVVLVAAFAVPWVVAATLTGIGIQDLGQLEQAAVSDARKATMIAALIIAAVVALVAYAVLWTFYTAREMNLFADYTTFDSARFRFNATVGSLVRLTVGNLLITILSLGIAQPFVLQRIVRYFCDRVSVDGVVDTAAISQSAAKLDRHGEGMVEAFDIDAF